VLDAQTNQNTPFDHVVDVVQPQRTLSHHPIFQALLSVNIPNHGALTLPGVEASLSDVAHDFSPFDISLLLADEGKGREIAGHIEFATDLFDSETIERWARHFVTLLRAMVADDRAAIGTLPLLESGERRRLLTDLMRIRAAAPRLFSSPIR
jgi:non-ribosomal peptide synthetase component F